MSDLPRPTNQPKPMQNTRSVIQLHQIQSQPILYVPLNFVALWVAFNEYTIKKLWVRVSRKGIFSWKRFQILQNTIDIVINVGLWLRLHWSPVLTDKKVSMLISYSYLYKYDYCSKMIGHDSSRNLNLELANIAILRGDNWSLWYILTLPPPLAAVDINPVSRVIHTANSPSHCSLDVTRQS